MKRFARGNELCADDQAAVKRAFIHRQTVENYQQNPEAARSCRCSFEPIPDADWLRITDFPLNGSGRVNLTGSLGCCTHDREIPARKALIDAWAATQIVGARVEKNPMTLGK